MKKTAGDEFDWIESFQKGDEKALAHFLSSTTVRYVIL